MTTLTTEPLATLIDRLYTQASAATSPALNDVSNEERERLMHSKTEYRELYGMLKDLWLPVSRDTGKLLYMLARSSKLGADFHDHKYLLVGWGDGEYFVAEHPPWSKAVKALVASDYPAMQVGGRETNPPLGVEARDSIPLAITERGYQQLVAYIDRSIAAGPDGKPIYLGKQADNPDRFYQATGSYSLFSNCNSWLAGALKAAEMPISGFNLTASSVFDQAVGISELQKEHAASPRPRPQAD